MAEETGFVFFGEIGQSDHTVLIEAGEYPIESLRKCDRNAEEMDNERIFMKASVLGHLKIYVALRKILNADVIWMITTFLDFPKEFCKRNDVRHQCGDRGQFQAAYDMVITYGRSTCVVQLPSYISVKYDADAEKPVVRNIPPFPFPVTASDCDDADFELTIV